MDVLRLKVKPNTWYKTKTVYIKYFMETEYKGLVDTIVVLLDTKEVLKKRLSLTAIQGQSAFSNFVEVADQRSLEVLYG